MIFLPVPFFPRFFSIFSNWKYSWSKIDEFDGLFQMIKENGGKGTVKKWCPSFSTGRKTAKENCENWRLSPALQIQVDKHIIFHYNCFMDKRRFSCAVSFVALIIIFLSPFIIDVYPQKYKKSRKKTSVIDSRLQQCRKLFKPNNIDEVLKCATILIIDYPKSAKAFSFRSQLYYIKGEFEMVLEDINRAISLAPEDAMHYYNRGAAYFKLLDYPAAERDFSKSIELNPKIADTYLWRVFAYEQQRKYREALNDIDKYIKMMPRASTGYSTRARLLYAEKRLDEALSDCFTAEALDPKNTAVNGLKGIIYLMKGKFEKARETFDRAIGLNPEESGNYNNRGVCNWLLGKKKDAAEDLKKSIKLSPKSYKPYYHLGYFMHHEKDNHKAKSYFLRAFELNPDVLRAGENVLGFTTNQGLIQFYKDELTAAREYMISAGKPVSSGKTRLEIIRIQTDPAQVKVGKKFVIVIEYVVSDPSLNSEEVPVNMNFKIIEGEKPLFNSGSITLQSKQGVKCTRYQNMNPTRRKGSFKLAVTLTYKNKTARKTMMIIIS